MKDGVALVAHAAVAGRQYPRDAVVALAEWDASRAVCYVSSHVVLEGLNCFY